MGLYTNYCTMLYKCTEHRHVDDGSTNQKWGVVRRSAKIMSRDRVQSFDAKLRHVTVFLKRRNKNGCKRNKIRHYNIKDIFYQHVVVTVNQFSLATASVHEKFNSRPFSIIGGISRTSNRTTSFEKWNESYMQFHSIMTIQLKILLSRLPTHRYVIMHNANQHHYYSHP